MKCDAEVLVSAWRGARGDDLASLRARLGAAPGRRAPEVLRERRFQAQPDASDEERWWNFDPRVEWLIDTLKMLVSAATATVLLMAMAFYYWHLGRPLETLARADRILVLDQGQLVEEGTHQSLLASGGMYARLAELQMSMMRDYMTLWQNSWLKMMGQPVQPVAEPSKSDSRFKDAEWEYKEVNHVILVGGPTVFEGYWQDPEVEASIGSWARAAAARSRSRASRCRA